MLYYFPLESYKERYTEQWAKAKTGWLERNWIKEGIQYTRIEGNNAEQREIKSGVVLDAIRRSTYAMSQVDKLLIYYLDQGFITDQDIIYYDDFWHPGIESLAYCFDVLNVHPKVFAFLHAQSVDEYDFTYPMRHWMRHFEKGIGSFLTGIFTSCPTLENLIVAGEIAPHDKVFATGHPFCSEEVAERMPTIIPSERANQVVWSSRWDAEKRPEFFCEVAKKMLTDNFVDDLKFVVCTGSKELRSNSPVLIKLARSMAKTYPDNFVIRENLTKEKYYSILCNSKVQFNCALQDFVAITLLESSVAGCLPVYPNFRSFPETFDYRSEYLYDPFNPNDAVEKIWEALGQKDAYSPRNRSSRAWIHTRFDTAWKSQWQIMQGQNWVSPYTRKEMKGA